MAPITALSPRPPRTPTAGAIRWRRSPAMAFPRRWDTQKPTRPEPALWFPMATFGGGLTRVLARCRNASFLVSRANVCSPFLSSFLDL